MEKNGHIGNTLCVQKYWRGVGKKKKESFLSRSACSHEHKKRFSSAFGPQNHLFKKGSDGQTDGISRGPVPAAGAAVRGGYGCISLGRCARQPRQRQRFLELELVYEFPTCVPSQGSHS